MDKRIDKEVLEYMEIYKTKKVTEEKIKLAQKTKEELSKLTGLKVEKIYVFSEYAWGKSDETPAFCFLSDVRIRDLNEKLIDISEYAGRNNMEILFWSMCQFEKRKNNPTELDYYIENYGVKIYDTEKIAEIDERVKATEYASKMDLYRWYYKFQKNNPKSLLRSLLEIYALKIDYPVNINQKLENTIEYIKHISADKNVLNKIEEFNKEGADQLQICNELEKYIKSLKQIRPQMKGENIATMDVYGRLLDIKNKKGSVNISNLTKENLYTMRIMQDKMPYEIAALFDINEKEITKMCKNFGFKVIDSTWCRHIGGLIAKAVDQDMDRAYRVLKMTGVFNFEKHTYDILKYMRDGERYLLKEFWKLVKGKREGLELEKATTAKDVYFRAYFCAELLKQNDFISEVDFLTYKITKKGKDLLERLNYMEIEELNLIEIAKITGEANFYALSIMKLNNGELMYCANADELDKYSKELEEWREAEFEEEFDAKLSKNTDKNVEENENLYVEPNKNEEIENRVNDNRVMGKIGDNAEDKREIIEVSFEDIKVKEKSKNTVKTQTSRGKADYNKINLSKEKIGKDSEKLVYDWEKERLKKEQREDLAKKVFWESEENGDGAGYDIKSFEKRNGEYVEIYIEVKGTNKSINQAFDISINEIEASNKYSDRYFIYRLGEIYSDVPKFYKINGRIEDNFELEAVNFKARKKI